MEEEAEGDFQYRPTTTVKSNPDQHHRLAARISSKLEDGDYRGAVKLACSESTFCTPDEKSLNRLQEKHPPPHPDTNLPSFHIPETPPMLEPKDITVAVSSFPSGSANGPDGMYPQHLKDLIYSSLGPVADKLIASLTKFVNLVLAGNVPSEARQFFFGAKLIGLHKANGSIRPIAIGCTLRRLVSKCACASVRDEIGSILFPKQLGFGVSHGIEAAVHAAREYLSNLETRSLVLKLDFQNAFNTLRRDKMLHAVLEKIPSIYPLAHCAYSTHSFLYYDQKGIILSMEGVQQGDPLGPLLFCIAIHNLVVSIKSEFTIFYLDDGTLGGPVEDVMSDLATVEDEAKILGLHLNHRKSELISKDATTRELVLSSSPLLNPINPENAVLLGSPIGSRPSLDDTIKPRLTTFEYWVTESSFCRHMMLCVF